MILLLLVSIFSASTIAADSFLLTPEFKKFEAFRTFKQRIADGGEISPDSLVATNPAYYNAYVLAGDYLYKHDQFKKALGFYQQALSKVIATKKEKEHILDRIKKINNQVTQ